MTRTATTSSIAATGDSLLAELMEQLTEKLASGDGSAASLSVGGGYGAYLRATRVRQKSALDRKSELAGQYWDRTMFEQAEALHRELWEERKRILGPNHADTIFEQNRIAMDRFHF